MGCRSNGSNYLDGEAVPSEDACEHCYCMKNNVVCVVRECKAPCEGCVPIPNTNDECCPEKYECAARVTKHFPERQQVGATSPMTSEPEATTPMAHLSSSTEFETIFSTDYSENSTLTTDSTDLGSKNELLTTENPLKASNVTLDDGTTTSPNQPELTTLDSSGSSNGIIKAVGPMKVVETEKEVLVNRRMSGCRTLTLDVTISSREDPSDQATGSTGSPLTTEFRELVELTTISKNKTAMDEKGAMVAIDTFIPKLSETSSDERGPLDQTTIWPFHLEDELNKPTPSTTSTFPPEDSFSILDDGSELFIYLFMHFSTFIFQFAGCIFEEKVFQSAEQIPRPHPCDFCFCFRGDIICLQQTCPPPIPRCYETPIQGFCCPRYECRKFNWRLITSLIEVCFWAAVQSTLSSNATTPRSVESPKGCQVDGVFYEVGKIIQETSGPCLECKCGYSGTMRCDPRSCSPSTPFMLRLYNYFSATNDQKWNRNQIKTSSRETAVAKHFPVSLLTLITGSVVELRSEKKFSETFEPTWHFCSQMGAHPPSAETIWFWKQASNSGSRPELSPTFEPLLCHVQMHLILSLV